MDDTTTTASVEGLRRAAEWRLLGLLFERPRPRWHDEVAAMADEIDDRDLKRAAALARDADEGGYLATLGPGSPVSPREVAWRGMHDPGQVLAELRSYYEAFGYHPKVEDPADHVAVEIGFMGYLEFKEVYAHECGDARSAEIARHARSAFARDHLDVLAAELPGRLEHAPAEWLAEAASVLQRLRPDAVTPRLNVLANVPTPGCPDDGDFDCMDGCPKD